MRVLLSWEGDLPSALTLARLRDAGHDVALLHRVDAATRRGFATGVPDFLVESQAACLRLPLVLRACDAAARGDALLAAAREAAPDAVAFAGLPGGGRRAWAEAVVPKAGADVLWPLDGAPPARVVEDAMACGVRAFVVACRPPLDEGILGRFVEPPLVDLLAARGVDPAGADGAHATFAVDGPGFARRVDATAGGVVPWDGGWRLDVGLRGC